VKVGLMLPVGGSRGRFAGWDEISALVQTAEAEGLDSVWAADHFFAGPGRSMHEAWSLLSGLAAVTSRIEIGSLVLCTSFRSPGLAAKMAVTVDEISRGRLVLGLGAGWYDPEYEAFGYPRDHKVGRFAEALEIVARLLRGEQLTFEGRYNALQDAALAPAPSRRIPILVAAERPRMLALAARWADARVTAWYRGGDEQLRQSAAAFEAALAAEGRDRASFTHFVGIDVDDELPSGVLAACAALGFEHAIVRFESVTPEQVKRLAASRE
jgi:alkanesulfonate monooxygenase SsuD/methylene tetrahydromethanopterin reductase-like flavin-dependent oxidoreductase (luciferase family)